MRISKFATFVLMMTLLSGCAKEEQEFGETDQPVNPVEANSVTPPCCPSETTDATETAVRDFRFYYAGSLTDLEPGAMARVWLPVAVTSSDQTVEIISVDLPGEHQTTVEERFQNSLIYFEAEANEQGEIPLEVVYEVQRKELPGKDCDAFDAEEAGLFLASSSRVPVNRDLTTRLFEEDIPEGNSLVIARQVYDKIGLHMRYDKPAGEPWGQGDSAWACDSQFGNCTDFHSLFLSVCRDLEIPGKFEIGFSIPEENGAIGGYHCWAKFASDGCWVPVDISEADKHPEMREYYFGALTNSRVTFSVGRDITLSPPQDAGPVNFHIYPYAEVNGEQHTKFSGNFRSEPIE